MGITIYLGAYVGDYIEYKYASGAGHVKNTSVLLSVLISIYMLIKQTKKLNSD